MDQRHFKVVDHVTKHETHSLVAVPLMVRGEVVGVLEALNKKDDAHYTEEDLTILETLGALAAQAMKNADLQRKCGRPASNWPNWNVSKRTLSRSPHTSFGLPSA